MLYTVTSFILIVVIFTIFYAMGEAFRNERDLSLFLIVVCAIFTLLASTVRLFLGCAS